MISGLEGLEADIAGVDSDDESEEENLEENSESEEEESDIFYGPIDVRSWPSSHARFLGYNI